MKTRARSFEGIRTSRLTACVIAALMAVVFVGAVSATPAFAWKMKTHAYSANLILEEVNATGGMLEIAPYGTFPVRPEYLAAIRAYPTAYRAGAIGPDGFPDMYVGQAFIHPAPNDALTDGTFTDEWLQQQWANVQRMPRGADRQKALAFVLGLLTHSAGDVFGHHYINSLSGGEFPSISAAISDVTGAKMRIIARHNITEAYIDGKIPAKYVPTSGASFEKYLRITAPETFVLNSLYTNGGITGGMNPLFGRFTSQPQPLKWALDTRAELVADIASYNESIRVKRAAIHNAHWWEWPAIAGWKFDIEVLAAKRTYSDYWIGDIDRGIRNWIRTNQVVAQKLLGGDYSNAKGALSEWAIHNGISMAGGPDFIGSVFGVIADFSSWVGSLIPQSIRDAIKQWMEDVIYDTLTYEAFGMRWSEIEALKTPEPWLAGKSFRGVSLFAPTVRAEMDAEMGNYPQELANANASTFKPFHNTVVMAKLVMVGPEGVNAILAKAGSSLRINQNIMLGWLRSLDGSDSWDNGYRVRPAGQVVHSPLYDERNVWCALFTGFEPGLTGGGFDKLKLDGVPMDWRYASWNGSGGHCQGNKTFTHAGKASVNLYNPSLDGTKDSDLWSPFVAKPGAKYTATVWAITDRDPATVQMHLQFLDAAGKPLAAPMTSGDKSGLVRGDLIKATQMLVTGTAPPRTATARLILRLKGGAATGCAAFADVEMRVVEGADDSTPPTTTAVGADDLWHNHAVTVTFSAVDNPGGYGVDFTEYRIDTGDWKKGTSVTLDTNGDHVVSYRSTDTSGNVEETKTCHVKLDFWAPQTGAIASVQPVIDAATGLRKYAGSKVWFDLTATDDGVSTAASGVAYSEFKLDTVAASGVVPGTWTRGTRIPAGDGGLAPGRYILSYRSTDNAGNVETVRSMEFLADSGDVIPPTTRCNWSITWESRNGIPAYSWGGGTILTPGIPAPRFTLPAIDNVGGSGVAYTEYKIDQMKDQPPYTTVVLAGTWTRGAEGEAHSVFMDWGLFRMSYRSVDAAGNVETTKTFTYYGYYIAPGI